MALFGSAASAKATESTGFMERAMGIEPIAGSRSINQIMLIRLPLLS